MRQLNDAAGLIPDRSYVAHFRACKQALILGVVAGHGMKEVDVFDGRQPINLEIAEPPEMQALAHHGVDSAVELVLFIAIFAGAIAEMLPGGHTVPVAGNSDRDQDAADRAREAGLV